MKPRSLNHWLALASNLGVMVGIFFLAHEMQQNTLATQLEAATNFQSSYSEIETSIYNDPGFAELLVKGRTGGLLNQVEALRLQVFYNNVLRQRQINHFQFLAGALNEDIWGGNRAFMGQVIGEDLGLVRHWRRSQDAYSVAFNDMLGTLVPE